MPAVLPESDIITLAGDGLSVRLQPAQGAQVISIATDSSPNVLFYEPWETPSPASDGASYGDSLTDWVSSYRGGWQELFPNPGAASRAEGVPLPFHGEVSQARWDVVDISSTAATFRVVARLPLVLERRMTVDPSASILRLDETVSLDAPLGSAFAWGHHPAFAAPPGAVIDVPAAYVWSDAHPFSLADYAPGSTGSWPHLPRPGGHAEVDLRLVPDGAVERLCYLRPCEGWAAVRDADSGYGVALAWDLDTFPFVWLWQQIGGHGFPWYGRARITAIEPQSSWPADGLAGAIERGHAHRLEPGQHRATWLTLVVFRATDQPVCGVGRDGTVLRQRAA